MRRLVAHCLDEEGADPRRGLGLVLVGDVVMRRLNRTYRAKDRTTDVLSFSFEDGPVGVDDPDARLLGEVVVSVPQCHRQATERGVPVGVELARLLVHGVLHVLGYDHETPAEAAEMRPRERRYRGWASRHAVDEGLLCLGMPI